ncbi:hypothetical protein FOXG_21199 [Fusarium oxysporum f. sp. lycopersici 4287]|uniref:Uncharacterized protein n=2 Tax=Fusarium oxysporum TaxID=5507 RepID=A0A0J9VVM0_FUSO4|nr:hypothetical protein FOXG_21199 [Fusarium oxysporum f. sp. lycopersici 4287]EXK36101.1 hypothetical protein FOMG_09290 [Fusarium oxysporum f. sp. melonis 26406]KNB14761.1 hypothetical protein FOXG_21199 [Fusarium oxysporum f. sp. lycopersici 4287]
MPIKFNASSNACVEIDILNRAKFNLGRATLKQ